jgi:hypothetical protein
MFQQVDEKLTAKGAKKSQEKNESLFSIPKTMTSRLLAVLAVPF